MNNTVEVNRKELLAALGAASAGLAEKESIPQSLCFVLDDTRIYTYNDNVGVCVPFTTGMRCAVPSAIFLALLRKLKKDDIILSFEEGTLQIRQGKRVSASIPVSADILLPFDSNIKPPTKLQKFPCSPGDFAEGVKRVAFTVCDDTQRMQLCGIHVGSDNKGTFVESTDRSRITRFYVGESTSPISLKIPIDPLSSLKGLKPTHYGTNEGWLYFKCSGDIQFACWTPAEDYPDLRKTYESVSQNAETSTVLFPKNIHDILDRAADFAVAGIGKDGRVVVSIKEGKAVITAKGDFGNFREVFKVESQKDASFRIHPAKLSDALKLSAALKISDTFLIAEGENFWHLALLDVLGE